MKTDLNADAGADQGAGCPVGVEARVCADIAERQKRGVEKYGTTVADNPLTLREWLQHAYEEHLDAAIYLRRAIEKLDSAPSEIAEDLFTSGCGHKAERLAMIVSGAPSPGGWNQYAVEGRVRRIISDNKD